MTAQEAKEILKDGIENVFMPMLQPVYEMAIEALEKQIAKKPIWADGFMVFAKCPVCKEMLDLKSNYCEKCGQSIDWSKCDD